MKSKILSIFSILALALGFAACDDHNYGNEAVDQGKLSFAGFGVDVVSAETEIDSRAGVDVSEFIVKIINEKNVIVEQSTYGSLPEVITLDAGDYTVKVISHEILKAEFDHPYYEGSSKITVKANTVTDAGTVTCRFSSIRVSIRYAENLFPLLGDDVQVRVRANDSGELTFVKDEQRSGYFEAVEGSTTLIAVFEGSVNGQKQVFRKELTDVEAGHHRIITFKVKGLPEPPEETGSIDPNDNITIDTSVEDVDCDGNVVVEEDVLPDNDRPGSDEEPDDQDPGKPDTPTPPTEDVFEVTSETIDIYGVNIPEEGKSYIVNIKSVNPLSNLNVKIVSESLNKEMLEGVGLTDEFDLAYPGAYEDALRDSFHFPVGNEVIGQNSVIFDITDFVPLLNIYPDETHIFELTLVDQNGNTQTVKLTFKS